MDKWADYLISGVNYNDKHTHINQVKAHKDNVESVGDPKIFSREDVVDAIIRGTTYVTIYKNDKGTWSRGQKVFIITINKNKYIKTVENNIEQDNLENLPEF